MSKEQVNYSMYEDEAVLIQALIRMDETAFRYAIAAYQASMLGLARGIVGEKIADEVVQEAWFSVMNALKKFEGRSSLKTWILRIVANEAKTRLRKENRSVSLEAMSAEDPEFANRFDGGGHWIEGETPSDWGVASPDELLTSEELKECLDQVIGELPELQAATLQLREQQGYALSDICNILDVSESNVRVLLHRARTRLFIVIEHFQETGECCSTL